MAKLDIGRYFPGRLYSYSISGNLYEETLSLPFGVGRDDLPATSRLIALLHETSHYVHDLSLGTCLNSDFLLDEVAVGTFALLAAITQKRDVVCPLTENRSAPSIVSEKERAALSAILEQNEQAEMPLHAPVLVDTSSLRNNPMHQFGPETELTGTHLLEGIVTLKTLNGLAQRVRDREDVEYLQEVAPDMLVLPEKLGPLYHLAQRLFDAQLGPTLGGRSPWKARSFPDDWFENNLRHQADLGFLYLADIALHVPPFEVISRRVQSRQNTPRDFIPVVRFIEAMAVIKGNNGFPNGNGGDFYPILFDWIAARKGWPGLEETQGAWEAKMLTLRDKLRRSMSDGYRFRMLVARRKNSASALIGEAKFLCAEQMVPLAHLTSKGMKLLQMFVTAKDIVSVPYEYGELDVWNLMNAKGINWQDAPEKTTLQEAAKLEMPRAKTFLQEIVMRSTCRSLQSAVLKQRSMKCPWSERGCHVAQPVCANIERLGDIPQKECALRKYVQLRGINPDRVVWKQKGASHATTA